MACIGLRLCYFVSLRIAKCVGLGWKPFNFNIHFEFIKDAFSRLNECLLWLI
ncbi:hypothetical protein F383_20812 [Gossypium arboreum]|uniref:Uncharacterized protein n=1 Tax=Gossypium arboreum TaxID=29729 RepID=A0A0B0NXI5_GOSAR|nr:hypothetical protein F383_20812 [Gossypium arboreum]